MEYTSRYNVFGPNGQVIVAAGAQINQAEAVRQGIEPLPAGMALAFDDGVAQLVAVEAEQGQEVNESQTGQEATEVEPAQEPSAEGADGDNEPASTEPAGDETPERQEARPKKRA